MTGLFTQSVQAIMIRDLDKLAEELALYPNEESVWKITGLIKNPGGNLCLHLCGNLQHFIGTVLGKTSYVRNRDAEFSTRNVPRAKLLEEISQTKKTLEATLPALTEDQLKANFPMDVLGKPMATLFFLIHLSAHLEYHLGQVNYHRRLVGS